MTTDDLAARVQALLENGKSIPPTLRNGLMLSLLIDLHRQNREIVEELKAIKVDVSHVKSKSILIWVEKHPRMAGFIALAAMTLSNAWFVSGYRKPILAWLLGVPEDTIP
ncbi:MAG TPA: hypothetical protein DCG54_09780 [Anaerolineae bacterium]|jgi:hypothetical protein|nr:hypothetical protein [Anaerolineae bacterium]